MLERGLIRKLNSYIFVKVNLFSFFFKKKITGYIQTNINLFTIWGYYQQNERLRDADRKNIFLYVFVEKKKKLLSHIIIIWNI